MNKKQSGLINLADMMVLELSAALDLVIDSEINHPEIQKEQLMVDPQSFGDAVSLSNVRNTSNTIKKTFTFGTENAVTDQPGLLTNTACKLVLLYNQES
jgi:hypothetical protein